MISGQEEKYKVNSRSTSVSKARRLLKINGALLIEHIGATLKELSLSFNLTIKKNDHNRLSTLSQLKYTQRENWEISIII